MTQTASKKEIEGIDWSRYDGPDYYDSSVVARALISLMELEDSSQANTVGDRLILAIGNNHAGTYYPAVLKALDIIIRIGENTSNNVCRICSKEILNNLYYFEPDVRGFSEITDDNLKAFVKEKLKPYSDEY